jgi:hypothetical protein
MRKKGDEKSKKKRASSHPLFAGAFDQQRHFLELKKVHKAFSLLVQNGAPHCENSISSVLMRLHVIIDVTTGKDF